MSSYSRERIDSVSHVISKMADGMEPPPFEEEQEQKEEDDLFSDAKEVILRGRYNLCVCIVSLGVR